MPKLIAMIGFLILGLSPSFEDFKQSPEDRGKMIAYYFVAFAFIWFGLDGWITGGK